jgi:2-keto-4-pentenoate hydratase/2-oxohepta-3-ene-1,7-dioic acid hydratase in catechol pathway
MLLQREEIVKLFRYGPEGKEKPGVLGNDGSLRDLTGIVVDIAGDCLLPTTLQRIHDLDPMSLPVLKGQQRIGACVGWPSKFLCIGLNDLEHAAESGVPAPTEPVVFMKATSAVCGPEDAVILPHGSHKTDWEVELGVVIGKPGKYIPESEALSHVAGYCVVNDLSERAWQLEGTGQWVKGKSADTFGPIGPWLVTTDEVPDPQRLNLWLEVDDHRYQDGSTRTMIFGVQFLVSYVSRFMSLHSGDIISTGTPAGVGLGQKPPVYLREGDRIRLGIEGLGEQMHLVVTERNGAIKKVQ